MTFNFIPKLALAAVVIIAGVAQASAYSIHVKDGQYKIECDNGQMSQSTTLEITHAQAAHFCKVRNSSISTGSSGNVVDGIGAKADTLR